MKTIGVNNYHERITKWVIALRVRGSSHALDPFIIFIGGMVVNILSIFIMQILVWTFWVNMCVDIF